MWVSEPCLGIASVNVWRSFLSVFLLNPPNRCGGCGGGSEPIMSFFEIVALGGNTTSLIIHVGSSRM